MASLELLTLLANQLGQQQFQPSVQPAHDATPSKPTSAQPANLVSIVQPVFDAWTAEYSSTQRDSEVLLMVRLTLPQMSEQVQRLLRDIQPDATSADSVPDDWQLAQILLTFLGRLQYAYRRALAQATLPPGGLIGDAHQLAELLPPHLAHDLSTT